MSPRPPVPTERLIARFVRSHHNDWSQHNRDNAVRVLNRVQQWLAGEGLTLKGSELDGDEAQQPERLIEALEDYFDHRRQTPKADGTPYATSSLLVEHRQLAAFYKWANRDPGDGHPLVARNPMRAIPAPQPEPPDPNRKPVAEDWQYDALLATCHRKRTRNGNRPMNDRRDAAIIAVLWFTGMRRSELCNLDYERIDWEAQSVYLPKTKGGSRTPKARWVHLPDEAIAVLDLWIDQRGRGDGPLFPSATRPGKRLEPQSVSLVLRRRAEFAGRALGCPPEDIYTPAHSFRRASAIAWLDNGGSETGLMRNHGWSSAKMIDDYTGPKADQLTAAEARRVATARTARRHLRAVGE